MRARLGLMVAMGLLLAGCGGKIVIAPPPPPPAPPPDIQLQVTVAADANPDRSGRPSPVVLRVFVLADAVAFDKASLDEMSGKPKDVLAEALLGENRLLVRPGERPQLTLSVPPAARFLGVTAEFADALGSTWRAKLPVDPAAAPKGGFTLAVERNQVLLQPAR
jgi:type VI secretion system protein VasD